MGIFPRMGQRSKILLPIRTNLSEYNELPELTTISSNTSIPSVQDGPTVVQRYRNLAIASGATLTTQYRCCGLVLVVDGDLTVNGTISMTARGASFQPSADYRIKNELLPGNDILYEIDIPATADEIAEYLKRAKGRCLSFEDLPAIYRPTLYCRGPHGGVYAPADLGAIPAVGAVGGSGGVTANGNPGGNGTDRRCGGGGGGGGANGAPRGGNGVAGTCFSGGSGGGGGNGATGGDATEFGGSGGNGVVTSNSAGGGAGNPGGVGVNGTAGETGTGGLLLIVCRGRLIVSSTGSIVSKGSKGGNGHASWPGAGGGGSGGGSINIFHGETFENAGSISAEGGAPGVAVTKNGGKGGDGCVTTDHYNF